IMCSSFFFFFQAEDGIRDIGVTGVQTCALPILDLGLQRVVADLQASLFVTPGGGALGPLFDGREASVTLVRNATGPDAAPHLEEIGRASCRERVEISVGVRSVEVRGVRHSRGPR